MRPDNYLLIAAKARETCPEKVVAHSLNNLTSFIRRENKVPIKFRAMHLIQRLVNTLKQPESEK